MDGRAVIEGRTMTGQGSLPTPMLRFIYLLAIFLTCLSPPKGDKSSAFTIPRQIFFFKSQTAWPCYALSIMSDLAPAMKQEDSTCNSSKWQGAISPQIHCCFPPMCLRHKLHWFTLCSLKESRKLITHILAVLYCVVCQTSKCKISGLFKEIFVPRTEVGPSAQKANPLLATYSLLPSKWNAGLGWVHIPICCATQ